LLAFALLETIDNYAVTQLWDLGFLMWVQEQDELWIVLPIWLLFGVFPDVVEIIVLAIVLAANYELTSQSPTPEATD
jgi:hypothetical protein